MVATLQFVANHKEGLVSLDRSGRRGGELVLEQIGLLEFEESARVQRIVAHEVADVAVNVIRPRAQGHVQDAAGHASVLCGIAGNLHLELLQRVDVRAHLRGAALYVAVVEAIDVEVGVGGARAVDRCEGALGTAPRDHPRNKEGQIGEVAPVQRKLLDLLLDDHVALDRAVLGVECDHLRIDRHGLSDLAELEFDVDTPVVPRPQFDSLLDMLLEAFGRDDQVVLAGNQRRERVVADRACR